MIDCSATGLNVKGGPKKDAVNAAPDWSADETEGFDWFGLLHWEVEREDPETGQWLYDDGYQYEWYGPTATLARYYYDEISKNGATPAEIAEAVDAKICEAEDDIENVLNQLIYPEVALPGPGMPIRKSAQALGKLLAKRETHFVRGGVVVRVTKREDARAEINEVQAQAFRSDFETVATLVKLIQTQEGDTYRDTICSRSDAEAIMACSDFREALPELKLVTNCPVLVEKGDSLEAITGYDRDSGVYANGEPVPEVSLDQAVDLLTGMLKDFKFVTPSDEARALAALITPALVMGGLLKGRAALDLGEANESQSGKGYRHKLTAAIYGELVHAATGGSGISKLDEAFDIHLLHSRPFVSLDNVRGKVDSTKLESFMTEDTYVARVAFHSPAELDPRRTCVMMTSNKAELSTDLTNRSSCVRIEKRPEGYKYTVYPEGTILSHVRAHQPLYLGAVFAVVKAWHGMGMKKSDETRHDFEEWRRVLDWIVQNIFHSAPLLDGHRETQQRMASPDLSWLRELILRVDQEGRCSEWLIASHFIEVLDEAGLDVPALRQGEDLADELVKKRCQQAMGRLLAKCFRVAGKEVTDDEETFDEIALDSLVLRRKETTDDRGHNTKSYMVYRSSEGPMDIPF